MGNEHTQEIKTTFQFETEKQEQQEQTFRHTVLEPGNLRQEVEEARRSERQIELLRDRLKGVTKSPPAAVQQAAQQQVRAAEPEQSWKEKRAARKQKEKELKKGRQITPHADEYTARVVEKQLAWEKDARGFRDFGYGRDDITEALTETITSMQSVRITADLFEGEAFVQNYTFLRETLEKSAYIARIATSPRLMEQLQAHSMALYATALYWQRMEPLVREMFRAANTAHGLNARGRRLQDHELIVEAEEDGVGLVIPNLVTHTRHGFGRILNNFRDASAAHEQAHQTALSDALETEMQQELTTIKTQAILESTEEQRGWADAPSLVYGNPENYEVIERLRGLMDGSRVYQENKKAVDAMFSDIIRRMEVQSELGAQWKAWEALQRKYDAHSKDRARGQGYRLWRAASDNCVRLMEESSDVSENLSVIHNALERLLQGKNINVLEAAVLDTYGYAGRELLVTQNRLDQLAGCRGQRMRWQEEERRYLLESGAFRTDNASSQYVTRAVTLFRRGDHAYNLNILETLRNYEKESNYRAPVLTEEQQADPLQQERAQQELQHRREYYGQVRQLVLPAVEKIMGWDMDRFLAMNDQQLMESQEELDGLFGPLMFVADLMKLENPDQKGVRMKEDLLGERLEEFGVRNTIARNLADKSRAMALKAMGRLVTLPEECFLPERNLGKLKEDSTQEEKLDIAGALLEQSSRNLQKSRDRWEEDFRQKAMDKYQRTRSLNQKQWAPSPLDAVAEQYARHFLTVQPDATQEEKDVIRRLKMSNYCLAAWDTGEGQAYAREKGLKKPLDSMGEPLFRTFQAYVNTPGAATQSPEAFRQMLRDLSAGAGLAWGKSAPQEIFEAREQNLRGVREYKATLQVSYDYLCRKYGYGLEKALSTDFYHHWEEILRDFGNVQVDMHFLARVPGAVDLNDPDDARLYHQVHYLAVVSEAVQSMLVLIGTGMPIGEVMEKIRAAATGSSAGPHREFLRKLENSGMAETITWGDRVKVGQRKAVQPEDPRTVEQRREAVYAQWEQRRNSSLPVAGRKRRIRKLSGGKQPERPTKYTVTKAAQEANLTSEEILQPYTAATEQEVEIYRAQHSIRMAESRLRHARPEDQERARQDLARKQQDLRQAKEAYAQVDPEQQAPEVQQARREQEARGKAALEDYRRQVQEEARQSAEELEQNAKVQKLKENLARLDQKERESGQPSGEDPYRILRQKQSRRAVQKPRSGLGQSTEIVSEPVQQEKRDTEV